MRKFTLAVLLFTVFLLRVSSQQQDEAKGTITGTNYTFSISAPSGWILDDQIWASQGIKALLYAKGKKFTTDVPFIYGLAISPNMKGASDLDSWVKTDVARMTAHDAKNSVLVKQVSDTFDGTKRIKYITIDHQGTGFYEKVAYLEIGEQIIMVILVSRDLKERKTLEPLLEQVVQSIHQVEKT